MTTWNQKLIRKTGHCSAQKSQADEVGSAKVVMTVEGDTINGTVRLYIDAPGAEQQMFELVNDNADVLAQAIHQAACFAGAPCDGSC